MIINELSGLTRYQVNRNLACTYYVVCCIWHIVYDVRFVICCTRHMVYRIWFCDTKYVVCAICAWYIVDIQWHMETGILHNCSMKSFFQVIGPV